MGSVSCYPDPVIRMAKISTKKSAARRPNGKWNAQTTLHENKKV